MNVRIAAIVALVGVALSWGGAWVLGQVVTAAHQTAGLSTGETTRDVNILAEPADETRDRVVTTRLIGSGASLLIAGIIGAATKHR